MADESIDSLVTPEKHEDGSISKSSASNSSSASLPTAHANNSGASIGSTRNLTEKSDYANGNKKAVPHYLRASTGSCHDFCKYGKKHSSEEEARKPLRKRIAKSLSNECPVQIFVLGKGNKEEFVNHKPLTATKNHSPADLNRKSSSPKPETSLDKKKVIKNKPSTDTKIHSPDLPSPNKKIHLRKPKNISVVKKTYSSTRNVSSGNKSVSPKSKPLSAKRCASPDPPEIVKSVYFPSKKEEDPMKRGSLGDNKPLKAEKKTGNLFSKSCSPVKSKPVSKVKPLSCSSDNLDGICGQGRKDGESVTGRNKASAKKVAAPRAVTLPSSKLPIIKMEYNNPRKAVNSKLVSNPKDRNITQKVDKAETPNNEKVPEKILHVIEIKNDNSLPSPPSDESPSHEYSSSSSSHDEDNKEEMVYGKGEADECKVPPVKENNKAPKKTKAVVVSEDIKTRSPVKLKFRNGKLLDVQSNNSTPRRLRFKMASVVGAVEGKGDLRRKIFKKPAANEDKPGEKVSSEKVILKHQGVQGKKDARGLLNNVIKETASKLVESRKSKVKALVGAFETVISLQESKPSSQVVS